MTHRSILFTPALLFATCLVLGCSGKASQGCSGGSAEAPVSGAEPFGVYKIDRYQNSLGTCEQLVGVAEKPLYLVLYSFTPGDGTDAPRLGGAFCGDLDLCRSLAEEAPEPAVGYSFLNYDDAAGWQGWAISNTGPKNDQCKADVQSHVLTLMGPKAIRIETKTVETLFAPTVVEGETATCHNRDAIAAAKAELPCKALLVVEATQEAGL